MLKYAHIELKWCLHFSADTPSVQQLHLCYKNFSELNELWWVKISGSDRKCSVSGVCVIWCYRSFILWSICHNGAASRGTASSFFLFCLAILTSTSPLCHIKFKIFFFFLLISCPHILRRAPVVCLWAPSRQPLPALLWKRIMGTFYSHNIINKSKWTIMWSIQLFPDALHPQLSPLNSLDKTHIVHADIVRLLFLAQVTLIILNPKCSHAQRRSKRQHSS